MNQPTHTRKSSQPNRLLDELIRYVRKRTDQPEGEAEQPIDNEQFVRTAVRQLRRHPIPASLLGASLLWLLLADDEDRGSTSFGRKVEDEVVGQIRGGFDYTAARLHEITDRYPWAAGAVLIAGGLTAAICLPRKKQQNRTAEDDSGIANQAGEVFGFESTEKDDDPPLR